MKKLPVLILIALVLPKLGSAELIISEVMYDLVGLDQGREWVEIYNNGTNEINILTGGLNSDWRFSDGTQHPLTVYRGSALLTPQSYAVIVDSPLRFLADWPSFSGTIFDSSMLLSNILGEISLLSSKNGQIIARAAYSSNQGADGNGGSLQLQDSGQWLAANPTPGQKNSSMAFTVSNKESNSSRQLSPSAHYSGLSVSQGYESPTLGVGLGRERIAAFGSPIEFRADTNLNTERYSIFNWNFGDGSQGGGSIVTHSYPFPGNYVVVLTASFNEGNAVARVNVKVVDPEFSIISADKNQITLKNNSPYEVSLFGRALVSGDKFFPFLKDTIIGSQQSLSFGSNITGLNSADLNNVYVAVLGDAEHPQFKAKVEEQRIKQIEFIKNKINDLQNKISEMFGKK